ncbi:predicted protein [Botrytis cinerea T4]|uniref:Uncharacterized protein n=1 Tax=Botryotinia fuckeliana (strain T4) TaxID=999810 RepID=G2XUD8_BOTF4|nr:predicted protein [Botrytis cinerea T4]
MHDLIATGLVDKIAQQFAQKGILRAFDLELEALFFRPFYDMQQMMQSEDLDN